VGCGAVLEQARPFNACLPTVGGKFSQADCMLLIVGVVWTMLWKKPIARRYEARGIVL
jgi:hypothetical protein